MRPNVLEECRGITIGDVRAAIPTQAIAATLNIGDQTLFVSGQLTNLKNGYMHYLACPKCGMRRTALYSVDCSPFKCRECHRLYYASSMKRSVRNPTMNNS